jgi:hypothetical protein
LHYGTIQEVYKPRPVLHFEGGWLILIDDTIRAILYEQEQWKSIDVSSFTRISLESRPDLDPKKSNLGLEHERFIHLPKAPLEILDPLTGRSLSVPFDVGPKISTQCTDAPYFSNTIRVETGISHPTRVYLLIQAGWGVSRYQGQTIGRISLGFDSGNFVHTDLRLGSNIRDWANQDDAITTLDSHETQTAWNGSDGAVPGVIDLLMIGIPEKLFSSTLEAIQIEDLSTTITSSEDMNPCIHLSGITISYLPLP